MAAMEDWSREIYLMDKNNFILFINFLLGFSKVLICDRNCAFVCIVWDLILL